MSNCSYCNGTRKVKCGTCKGYGSFLNCPACNSTGEVKCSFCDGTGYAKRECPVCDWRGKIEKTRWINCSRCHGKGVLEKTIGQIRRGDPATSCPVCDGRGQVKETYEELCPSCHGVHFLQSNVKCAHCSGTGKAVCGKCGGSGHQKCTTCNGTGHVSCEHCSNQKEYTVCIPIRQLCLGWTHYESVDAFEDADKSGLEDPKAHKSHIELIGYDCDRNSEIEVRNSEDKIIYKTIWGECHDLDAPMAPAMNDDEQRLEDKMLANIAYTRHHEYEDAVPTNSGSGVDLIVESTLEGMGMVKVIADGDFVPSKLTLVDNGTNSLVAIYDGEEIHNDGSQIAIDTEDEEEVSCFLLKGNKREAWEL